MKLLRIALANLRFPSSREESVAMAIDAIRDAARDVAAIVCFPECFVPGYRAEGKGVASADAAWLEQAWTRVAAAVGSAGVAVILGTERVVDGALRATALVMDATGTIAGFQDKVQIDPSEEGLYAPGAERQVFHAGELTFGIAICHEGWRYPETVRWAAMRGAHVVFHPHFHEADATSHRPAQFGERENTFHEKAILCRAAENSCYFASVNFASAGSPTTSAVANPDGTLLAWQPYGLEGLLVADIDLELATGLLASRYKGVD